jgi:hypothetical protein
MSLYRPSDPKLQHLSAVKTLKIAAINGFDIAPDSLTIGIWRVTY